MTRAIARELQPIVVMKPTGNGFQMICSQEACRLSLNPIAKQIYTTVVKVRQFFLEKFGHVGLDGRGKMVPVAINWDNENAQWSCQAGSCLLRFHNIYAVTPEVVAHEYMHGITANMNDLTYYGQSGALNESLSDVMGIAFKQWLTGRVDWKMGNLRDLSQAPQPYVHTNEDNGGVHTNSAIPNHAFYLAAIGARSVDAVAKIWFRAFQQVSHGASFKEFAKKTIEIAKTVNRDLAFNILAAWNRVGVIQVKVEQKLSKKWDFSYLLPFRKTEVNQIYHYA